MNEAGSSPVIIERPVSASTDAIPTPAHSGGFTEQEFYILWAIYGLNRQNTTHIPQVSITPKHVEIEVARLKNEKPPEHEVLQATASSANPVILENAAPAHKHEKRELGWGARWIATRVFGSKYQPQEHTPESAPIIGIAANKPASPIDFKYVRDETLSPIGQSINALLHRGVIENAPKTRLSLTSSSRSAVEKALRESMIDPKAYLPPYSHYPV